MNKYLAEIIGTFALVLCGTGAIVLDQYTDGSVTHLGISIAFGLIVTLMISAFGKISGAHLNPAVSIAFATNKDLEWKQVSPFVISQISGALLASLILKFTFPSNELLGATLPSGSVLQSFLLEVVLTFILMLVILISPAKIAAITIGATVGLEAFFAGPISGASMNPARSLGPSILSGHTEHLWIYIIAPVIGAVLAVLCRSVFKTKNI